MGGVQKRFAWQGLIPTPVGNVIICGKGKRGGEGGGGGSGVEGVGQRSGAGVQAVGVGLINCALDALPTGSTPPRKKCLRHNHSELV